MHRPITALALAMALGLGAPVRALEIIDNPVGPARQLARSAPPQRASLPVAVAHTELPEPEMIAMMLLGLVLIGWRARRDSAEKFN